jgi:hypothetical protein
MPDWLMLVFCAASGLIGGGVSWGTLYTRVSRVEKDVAMCVGRDLYQANQAALFEKVSRVERLLEKMLHEDSGRYRPSPGARE